MSSFSGFDLSALQALMAQQAKSSAPAVGPGGYPISPQMQAREGFLKDLQTLRQEAGVAARRLMGAQQGQNAQRKYLGQSYYEGKSPKGPLQAGADYAGYGDSGRFFANALGISGMGAAPSSQFFQDMMPYLDRYNQLRNQYAEQGYKPDFTSQIYRG